MWISQNIREKTLPDAGELAVGKVTIGGAQPAVFTDGEYRNAELMVCGGCISVPETGDEVLLARTADKDCLVVGRVAQTAAGLSPGDVRISSRAGASLTLKNNGDIVLGGQVTVQGKLNLRGDMNITGRLFVNGVQLA